MTHYSSYSNIEPVATFNDAMIAGWNLDEIKDTQSFSPNLADMPYMSVNYPSALFYNNKTYITYNGKDDKPFIITYNHLTGLWSDPVNISSSGRPDYHGQPCMLIDNDGYIHIMWNAHDSNILHSISDNIEDITAWTVQASPATGSYPQLIKFSTGRIYLFYRITGIGKEKHFKTSDDNGVTWSSATHLTTNFAYILFRKGIGDTILAAMWGNDTTTWARKHIYYMWFDGTNWKNIDGVNQTLPVVLAGNNVLAYNSGNYYIPYITLSWDNLGVPYILFIESIVEFGLDYFNVKILRRSGGVWVVNSLGISGRPWQVHFNVLNIFADRIDVFTSQTDIVFNNRWNIERWSSFNNGITWEKIETIKRGEVLHCCQEIQDYNSDGRFIFCEFGQIDNDILLENQKRNNKGYLWGDGGIIENSTVEYSNYVDEIKDNDVFYGLKVGAITPVDDSGICYEFHGNPDTIGIKDNDLLSFGSGSPDKPFSFSFEIKASDTVTSQILISKAYPWEWNVLLVNNKIQLQLFGLPDSNSILRSAPFNTINQWKFICITYDGGGLASGIKIYIDNIQSDNISGGAGTYVGMTGGTANVYIGCINITSNYYVGKLRRFRIWDKVISDSERILIKDNNLAW